MDTLDEERELAALAGRLNRKHWNKPHAAPYAKYGAWTPRAQFSTVMQSDEIAAWREEQRQATLDHITAHIDDLTFTDAPQESTMTRHLQTGQTGSQKQNILALYRERSDGRPSKKHGGKAKYKGWVGLTVIETAQQLGYSTHDVTHALYDLRKQGLVGFSESKHIGKRTKGSQGSTPLGSVPVRIRITKKGIEMATPTDIEFEDSIPSEPDTAALDDNTIDALNSEDHQRNLAYDPTAPDRPTETDLLIEREKAEAAEAEAEAKEAAATYMTDPRVAGSDVVDAILNDLPLINTIRMRADKVSQAEALLREAGLTEAADLVQGEKEVRTGLEREVLELLQRLNFA